MIKHIPNCITSLNLLCGCLAVFFAVHGHLAFAAVFVFLGIFFDFFDGLAARLLRAQSGVGLQLDSLADMVTSGVAPAMVMVQLLAVSLTGATLQPQSLNFPQGWGIGWQSFLPFAGLFIAVAAGHRLAKFNVDTRQTTHFIGVPTPAIALLVLSFPLILEFQYTKMVATVILNPWFLLATTLLCGILMNVEMPLFALKFKTWGFKPNRVRYIFLVLSAVALFVFHFLAIPLLILSYILLSLFWREGERSLKL